MCMCAVCILVCSEVEEAVSNELKDELYKSEEERRKLVKEYAIYQSQLEVCVVCMYCICV